MRCPRCGNENSEDNRFCGMCGAKLLAPMAVASVPAQSTTVRAAANAPSAPAANVETSSAPRGSAPVSDESRGISGPSFLGLSDAAHRPSGNLSSDRHSGNLDYLLEDDEPKRGGGGKFVLILFALALAVLFGYLRFKVLKERPGKAPAPATQDSVSDSSSATPPAVSTGPSAPAQPAAGPTAQPAGDSSASGSPASNPAAAPDAGRTPAASTPPAAAAPAPAAKDASAPAPAAKEDASAANDAPSAAGSDSANAGAAAKESPKEDADTTDDTQPPPTPKPKKTAAEPAAKPHAGITPTQSTDSVIEAQKYIYGRGGVAQDCERGMRLLKPAAAQANPKAMIEMGALYSAGLCTPHDLPTAYRWFAMALRKDPNNQSVQADLQKLWGEMTPPERQLAIKLSQ